MEKVSNLATKFFEDARLGISPLEKSSRYVYFDKKENGKYQYLKEKFIMETKFSEKYIETLDYLFDTYVDLIDPLTDYYKSKLKRENDLSERAYNATIRAKVCDTIRGLLPAATLTNMGLYGNGRAFEYLIIKSQATELEEIKNLGQEMYSELNKIIPSFVKRRFDSYGDRFIKYLKTIKKPKLDGITNSKDSVKLIHYDNEQEAIDKILEKILFVSSFLSFNEIKQKISKMNLKEKLKIIVNYKGERTNRRHKPYRAFENIYYTFELFANFGAYRDLQRHRILTQERQVLTTYFGYDIPKDIVKTGLKEKYEKPLKEADKLYRDLAKISKDHAQYVVPFAYKMRWYVTLNLREMFHFIELRSIKQGHPDYRNIVQKMYLELEKVQPNLATLIDYVDLNNYEFERLDAEKNIDKKLNL